MKASGRKPGLAASLLARFELLLTPLFGSLRNPFHHLGALVVYFFWIVLVSGIYLLIFYRTSLSGAWLSVEELTRDQPFAGGVMRSLHRYASDAALLVLGGHLLREFLRGRFRGPRWYSWFTGVPLLWIVILLGITGYWMVWDQLAQFVAVGSAHLLDVLPVFSDPMVRSFLTNDSVSDRFFTLIAFIHLIGLPIVLVLGIWFHVLRIRIARINPPRTLMAGSLIGLLILSLLVPAESHAPADLAMVPAGLALDWFYLGAYPLIDRFGEHATWAGLSGLTLLLAALPWLWPGQRAPVAQVRLSDCTGCGYCADDCPYGAIDIVPRSDGRKYESEARVSPDLCVGCGICTGSCPSSSPFRRQEPLTTGIELPNLTMDSLKQAIRTDGSGTRPAVLLVGCDHGVPVSRFHGPGLTTLSLPCIGMLPPAAIDYALRVGGFDGVMLGGCAAGDCHHRYGDRWTRDRIRRARPPLLRARVPRERILMRRLKPTEHGRVFSQLKAFRHRLRHLIDPQAGAGS
ncbi:MAG: hydrogenase iron-sulfur subunit [Gammaproteobacteria bacterium]|nr:hydrogenase iron-sulfur subunit [Gammaproteobacteria bacterium]